MFATANDSRWFGAARELSACALPARAPGAEPLSMYWLRPDQGEGIAGVGVAASVQGQSPRTVVDAARSASVEWLTAAPDVPGPWFGGFAFDGARARAPEWAGFGTASFILPRCAVATRGGRTWALAFCEAVEGEDPRALLDRWLDVATQWAAQAARQGGGTSFALEEDRAHWDALVGRSLEEISSGRAEKIVAARRVRVALWDEPTIEHVLRRLADAEPWSTTFLMRGSDGSVFVGATPETLVRSDGTTVSVDALAGTLADGASGPMEDKLLREHHVVVDGIVRALSALPARVEADPVPRLRTLRHVRHLFTPVTAHLDPSRTVADATATLHPTAAIAGAPREAAVAFLREHEGFDRGWYAGAIGVVGPERTHLCVALRSALLRGRHAWAYAGAGLVAGSEASAEWDETSLKLRTILGAFGGEG